MVVSSRISTRVRVASLLLAVLIVYIGLNMAALGGLVFPAIAGFEREDAIRNSGRVAHAVRRELGFLGEFSQDWAHWDETYDFVDTFSQSYFDGNLTEDVTASTPADVIALYGADGRPRHLGVYRALEPPEAALAMLDGVGIIYREVVLPLLEPGADEHSQRADLFVWDGRPLMVSGHAILRSDHSGPARGVLLMAALLDDDRLERLADQTLVDFDVTFHPPGHVPTSDGATFQTPTGDPGTIHTTTADRLQLGVALPAAGGGQFEFMTDFERRMTRQGAIVLILALAISTLSFVLLVGGLYYRLLARSFLLPLRSMVDVLERIEDHRDLAARLPIEGAAELQRLARSFNAMMSEVETQRDEITLLSLTDELTGLPNRRQFEQAWQREWQRALRRSEPLAILLADIDRFKAYNDRYGHLDGDDCLRRVAQAMKGALKRRTDFIARFGGEEFVLILPDTGSAGALTAAQRIRDAVRALQLPQEGADSRIVTISIGVHAATPDADSRLDDWIAQADTALYDAKAAGRDRVVMSGAGIATDC
jgi:diguanylate cyclase (GGDEF)-like protein